MRPNGGKIMLMKIIVKCYTMEGLIRDIFYFIKIYRKFILMENEEKLIDKWTGIYVYITCARVCIERERERDSVRQMIRWSVGRSACAYISSA